jgi:hypothetical protein
MRTLIFALLVCAVLIPANAQDKTATNDDPGKPRVFITDSQSWEVGGGGGGTGGAYGSAVSGGARPQTAEIIKTFGERCPGVMVNNIQQKADYIVLLDHEGGKGLLRHKNKVAVFARVSGDSVVSKSTLSLGGSVQEACDAIGSDWTAHGTAIRAATADAKVKPVAADSPTPAAPPAQVPPSSGSLAIVSVPDGADIEIDGGFVGNTPSDVQVPEGEHSVSIKKTGFKSWERKLKVTSGSSVHLNAELEKTDNP